MTKVVKAYTATGTTNTQTLSFQKQGLLLDAAPRDMSWPTCQVAEGQRAVRPQPNHLLQAGDGLVLAPQLLEGHPHPRERVSIIRPQSHSLLHGGKHSRLICISQPGFQGRRMCKTAQAH